MSATLALPLVRRRGWPRLRVVDEVRRPTAALSVRWSLDAPEGVVLDNIRVRAGRVPGVWSDTATVRPAPDGTLSVVLRLPVEVWAAPAVLDFTITLAGSGSGRTYSLTTAEPFFWNGSRTGVDVELCGHVHDDGAVEPRVTDVLVHF